MCLHLPRYLGEVADDVESPDLAIARGGGGETVLVIDDEPTVRMLIVETLKEAGYTPLEAEDGPSGLKVLQSSGRVSLLITDVGLPGGMNGRQVADAARVDRPFCYGICRKRSCRKRTSRTRHAGDHETLRHVRTGHKNNRNDRELRPAPIEVSHLNFGVLGRRIPKSGPS
jgi:CheY-like chemotaxis protein